MLSGAETASSDNCIQGTCFINSVPLITIIDTGATHSFISTECVKILNLEVFVMNGSMAIDTLANS